MATRRTYTDTPWEKQVGYCRAIRKGNFIAVSGTTSVTPDGTVWGENDAFQQAMRALETIIQALQSLGGSRKDILRTRMFVTDISRWKEFGRAHSEYFGDAPPATSMYEIKSLINPKMLIEIEADAICGEAK
jgi:enamine deaminase RidA (YjgF/YER057c/UK114 family)